jgi:hypothetical protein
MRTEHDSSSNVARRLGAKRATVDRTPHERLAVAREAARGVCSSSLCARSLSWVSSLRMRNARADPFDCNDRGVVANRSCGVLPRQHAFKVAVASRTCGGYSSAHRRDAARSRSRPHRLHALVDIGGCSSDDVLEGSADRRHARKPHSTGRGERALAASRVS